MVYVEILGGFGNQLSAYAWSYSLAKHLGQELVLDVSDYTQKGYFRPYCLDQLRIGHHRKLMYPPYSANLMDPEGIPPSIRASARLIRSDDVPTREELLKQAHGAKDVYLMGYGGLQYCTDAEKDELREQFRLKTESAALRSFRARIKDEYSVAIHVRRTDFVLINCQSSDDFYRAAITYVRERHPNAQFYFFSDDIEYVKEQFGPRRDFHYVRFLGGMDADLDEFYSISACNARILSAQSSFSWWARELSRSEERLNVCAAKDGETGERDGIVYLSDEQIASLAARYVPGERHESALLPKTICETAIGLLSQEQNEKAIALIDQYCIDGFAVSSDGARELAMLKAVAQAQSDEKGLDAALLGFYDQMQTAQDDPVFHANYFMALYRSGRLLESAIHAARANRCGDSEDYGVCFEGDDPDMTEARELYQLLRDTEPMRFVFIPIEGWNYFLNYVKSLAILLARMGQEVLYVCGRGSIPEASDELLAQAALRYATDLDSVYNYHVKGVRTPFRGEEGTDALYGALFSQCAARSDRKTAVVASFPDALEQKIPDSFLRLVPDITDPLNREELFVGDAMDRYFSYMSEKADAFFLPDAKAKHYKNTRVSVPTWTDGEYIIADTDVGFTPNYIASNEMLKNAAAMFRFAARHERKLR